MAILVILIRHAKPLALDPTQKLSDSGKMMQKRVNDHLKNDLLIQPTALWTSPILRALETAQMIGREFKLVPEEIIALGELEMFDEIEITNMLKEMPDESTVIIVSHAPQIMRLGTYWKGSQLFDSTPPTSSATFIEFPKKVKPGTAYLIRVVTYSDLPKTT